MTYKEKVVAEARDWSEEQAERAHKAAGRTLSQAERVRQNRVAMELAAAARAGQTEVVDAAALIREVRDEMEQHSP
jgi:ribosome-binding ATPase YchF (GTP1/OBG family)